MLGFSRRNKLRTVTCSSGDWEISLRTPGNRKTRKTACGGHLGLKAWEQKSQWCDCQSQSKRLRMLGVGKRHAHVSSSVSLQRSGSRASDVWEWKMYGPISGVWGEGKGEGLVEGGWDRRGWKNLFLCFLFCLNLYAVFWFCKFTPLSLCHGVHHVKDHQSNFKIWGIFVSQLVTFPLRTDLKEMPWKTKTKTHPGDLYTSKQTKQGYRS